MKFLPYEKLSYNSPLKKEDAIKRLSAKIDPNPPFLNWKFGKLEQPFKGTINGDKFMISKIQSNNMKPGPCFFGEILENEEGSTIHVIIKPFSIQIAFSILFFCLFLFVGLSSIAANGFTWTMVLFLMGFILVSYTVAIVVFKFKASFMKDDLKEILEVKGI